jgi:phosphoribosylglycinamide formyltransferase 1
MSSPLRVAVLASGEGTTLDDVATELSGDGPRIQISLVVSDRAEAGVIARAARHGIPVEVIPSRGPGHEGWSERLTDRLEAEQIDVVVLAGYLSILPPGWVARWQGRAFNLHPSLLPKYGGTGMHGLRVHAAVLAAGDTETGATLHLVTGTVDGGPPVRQARLPVRPDDTPERLRSRLHPVEVRLVSETLRALARGELPLPYTREGERADDARRA